LNVESAYNAPVFALPDVGLLPLHAPDAVQLSAFLELQVRVDEVPKVTLVGDALSVTVGAVGGVGGTPFKYNPSAVMVLHLFA
jgi:hypothetical protein